MKYKLVIVMIVCSFDLFSLDHGLISGFEVGYNLYSGSMLNTDNLKLIVNNNESLYIQMKTGYRVENLRLIGTYNNTLKQIELDRYMPIQDNYKVEINYTLNNITVGFFHWCDHPVVTPTLIKCTLSNSWQRAFYIRYYREF